MNYLVSMTLFNVFPTTLEISLVTGIVATKFGSYHALACLATGRAFTSFSPSNTAPRGYPSESA